MPPAPNQTRQSLFQATRTVSTRGAQAAAVRHYPVEPQQQTPPAPTKALKPRYQVQAAWIALLLVTAFVGGGLGMAYLSACASVTHEGHRKASLKSILRQEREKAQFWRELRGQVMTPAAIERKAKTLGMVRGDEQKGITIR